MRKTAKFLLIDAALAVALFGLAFFVLKPFSALAAEEAVELDISEGNVTITSTGYTVGESEEVYHTGEYIITGTTTENKVVVQSGNHTITIKDLSIDFSSYNDFSYWNSSYCPIDIHASVECTLKIAGTSTLQGGYYQPAVKVAGNSTLIIDGDGVLNAAGGMSAAGIGESSDEFLGSSWGDSFITITGGTVIATGGSYGAGIGGGSRYQSSSSKIITISGGNVTAIGGDRGAGIGGGWDVVISGGMINAQGGNSSSFFGGGAGIGGNYDGDGGNITIYGGEITAQGGDGGAGIGGGREGTGGTIVIEGGTITATGGDGGAGIGGGSGLINGNAQYYIGGEGYGSGGNITINGGTITAQGGTNAAGIGGGDGRVTSAASFSGTNGRGGTININGGNIKATGGDGGAGIGGGSGEISGGSSVGGSHGDGGNITITGGTVEAQGGTNAAGIGGGSGLISGGSATSDASGGNGGDITISGGEVTATGGSGGAGIGGGNGSNSTGNNVTGNHGNGGNVTITDGEVTATGGAGSPGIGGGQNGSAGSVTVDGGFVEAHGDNGADGIQGTVSGAGGVINGENSGDSTLTATAGLNDYTYGDGITITGTAYPKTGLTALSVTAYCYNDDEKIDLAESEFDGGGYSYTLTIDTKEIGAGDRTITVELTLNDGPAVSKTVTVNIKKAELNVEMFDFTAPTDLVYDGDPKEVSVTFKEEYLDNGVGEIISVKYNGSEDKPVNTGEYTVSISVSEGTNYNAAEELTSEEWNFTIKSSETESEDTEPSEGEPEDTEPSESEPEDTEPSESEPEVTESSGNTPNGTVIPKSSDNSVVTASVTAAVEAAVAAIPTTSSVKGVKSTVSGAFLIERVNGVAFITPLADIVAGYGLAPGEKVYAMVWDLDPKKSYLAQQVIDSTAAALGAEAGPVLNIELGKKDASGKYTLLYQDGPAVTIKVGVPASFVEEGKTLAVVRVRPGGAVSVLADLDTDADTVTFTTTGGAGAYAIVKY